MMFGVRLYGQFSPAPIKEALFAHSFIQRTAIRHVYLATTEKKGKQKKSRKAKPEIEADPAVTVATEVQAEATPAISNAGPVDLPMPAVSHAGPMDQPKPDTLGPSVNAMGAPKKAKRLFYPSSSSGNGAPKKGVPNIDLKRDAEYYKRIEKAKGPIRSMVPTDQYTVALRAMKVCWPNMHEF